MKHFFLLLTLSWSLVSRADLPDYFTVGEEVPLPATSSRLWIGDPKLLRARVEGQRIALKPLKKGSVEVRWGKVSRRLAILTPSAARTFQNLRRGQRLWVGLKAELREGQVILSGRLHRIEDLDEAMSRLPEDPEWELRAAMSPAVREAFLRRLARHLGLETKPALQFAEAPLWLSTGSPDETKELRRSLQRFGVRVVRDEAAVATEPVVRVDVAVAEIRRDAFRKYGITWPATAEAKLLPDGSLTRPDLAFNAHALEKSGNGRLLARPTLLCRSGKEAEFIAGGEFPVKVIGYRTQGILWKHYGITVRVKPKADRSGRMSIALTVEVSSLDNAVAVDGVPGLLTNRVASHFDLTRPRVIALSGLIKQQDGRQSQGLPGLTSLPVIGALFSSRDWQENRTELVIFVRPEIVSEEKP
ncbi:MAG: pilus assembly protein [Bdellovibrionaceae bacterium]|nr:pilus assembly protein [Pseudobdellovibrionaceae bacterium]MBX3034397.1 pilus assembly protein [Pseudobdellovibrionaceae bacterium]